MAPEVLRKELGMIITVAYESRDQHTWKRTKNRILRQRVVLASPVAAGSPPRRCATMRWSHLIRNRASRVYDSKYIPPRPPPPPFHHKRGCRGAELEIEFTFSLRTLQLKFSLNLVFTCHILSLDRR